MLWVTIKSLFIDNFKHTLNNLIPSVSFRYKRKMKKRPRNRSDTWLKFAEIEGIFSRISCAAILVVILFNIGYVYIHLEGMARDKNKM